MTYEDVGGLEQELEQVREMIELPMRHPELFRTLGIEPPKGVLLHAPPGTGKTLIARAVANEIDAHFRTISGPEIMSKYYGESEERLREVFEEAAENEPAIVFIDEPDEAARREIFEIHTRDRPLSDDVDLDELAAETQGYTGADVEAVCREAATIAVREHVLAEADGEDRDVDEIELTADHFEGALEAVSPESAAEFESGPGASDFDEVLEGAEGEA